VPSLKSILAGTALCVLGFMTSSLHAQQVLNNGHSRRVTH